MNPNFSNKGTISVSGTIVVKCDDRTRKLIRCMKFRNPLGYTLTIDVYDKYSNTTVTTTLMSLSAGDQLIDDDELYLEPGDKITVTSNISGTTFIITGEDIDLKKR
jgi:hypothetical protein